MDIAGCRVSSLQGRGNWVVSLTKNEHIELRESRKFC